MSFSNKQFTNWQNRIFGGKKHWGKVAFFIRKSSIIWLKLRYESINILNILLHCLHYIKTSDKDYIFLALIFLKSNDKTLFFCILILKLARKNLCLRYECIYVLMSTIGLHFISKLPSCML